MQTLSKNVVRLLSLILLTFGTTIFPLTNYSLATSKNWNKWNCSDTEEGGYSCVTSSLNETGTGGNLTFNCNPDGNLRHAFLMFEEISIIKWKSSSNAKLNFDGKVETFRTAAASGGKGLVIGDFGKANSVSKTGKVWNASSWKLLAKIASVRKISVEAKDSGGVTRKISLDVSNSIPIAAKFNVSGCRSS